MRLSDEQVDLFAIRAAKGNNGGKWSEHYTEEQREFWRRFIRDLENTIDCARSGDVAADEILVGTRSDMPPVD